MGGSPAEGHIINMMGDHHPTEGHTHLRNHHQHHIYQQESSNIAAAHLYATPSSPAHRSPLPHGGAAQGGSGGIAFDHLDSRAASTISAYATPRMSTSAIPYSGKDDLNRSLSMSGATFSQYQPPPHHRQQMSSPGGRSSYAVNPPSTHASLSSIPATHSAQMSASSSRTGAGARQSLLPTMTAPYGSEPLSSRSPGTLENGGRMHAGLSTQSLTPNPSFYGQSYLPSLHERPPSGYGHADSSSYQTLEAGYGGLGLGGNNAGGGAGKSRNMDYSSGGSHSRQASPAGVHDEQVYPRYYASQAGPSQQSDAGRDSLPYAYTPHRLSVSSGSNLPMWSSPSQQSVTLSSRNNPSLTKGYSQQQWDNSQSLGLMRSASGKVRAAEEKKSPRAPPPPREVGLRRIRDLNDLRPKVDQVAAAITRRADPAGGFVSPLKAMTSYLHHTYHLVNPSFIYELSFNPRRVLTKPSKPMHNNGHDNVDSDYILYVNDWLGNEEGNRYLILDSLGQGTFGQVVKCQNMRTHEIVAVKVIKNKPAYYKQSMMEVTILEMLNVNWDPEDKHHILRLRDTFIHAEHLCLVFELLSSNLYELIKQNSFRGLSTSLVRVFTAQLLDALTVLNEANLIHCDLKPENILLRTLQTPSIKLVDFGSACHEKQTVYTYIQSRFYRSPEVLLGLPYNSAIDLWSLGCIAVELFLGLPLFPGTSEFNQICRIVEMLGLPPAFMLEQGKQTGEFFNIFTDDYGRKSYRLKSIDQYNKEHPNLEEPEQPSKVYFSATTLPDIIKTYPLSRKSGRPADAQKEMANRTSFVDFVSGLLNMDPHERWTPQQAVTHPFITGEKFVKAFKPAKTSMEEEPRQSSSRVDPMKHQFGGLPQTNAKSSGRAYHDAAAYNQHLAQQQAYNSAHKVRQSAPVINNPYAQDQAAAVAAHAKAQQQHQHAQAQAHARAQAQAQVQAHAQLQAVQAHAGLAGYGGPLPDLSGTVENGIGRDRMDAQGANLSSGLPLVGNSTTPGREDWEKRQQQRQQHGGGQILDPSQYAQLSLLQQSNDGRQQQQQQQHGHGQGNWLPSTTSPSYASSRQNSSQTPSRQYQGVAVAGPSQGQGGFSVIVEGPQDQRSLQHLPQAAAGGAVRESPSAISPSQSSSGGVGPSGSRNSSTSLRYSVSNSNNQAGSSTGRIGVGTGSGSSGGGGQFVSPSNASAPSTFDAFDSAQPSIAQLMPALKPQQYHAISGGAMGSGSGSGSGHLATMQQLQPQRHSMVLPRTGSGSGNGGGTTSGGGAPYRHSVLPPSSSAAAAASVGMRLSSPLSGGLSPTSAGFDDHFTGVVRSQQQQQQLQQQHGQGQSQSQQHGGGGGGGGIDRRYSSQYGQQQPDLSRF